MQTSVEHQYTDRHLKEAALSAKYSVVAGGWIFGKGLQVKDDKEVLYATNGQKKHQPKLSDLMFSMCAKRQVGLNIYNIKEEQTMEIWSSGDHSD